MTELIALRSLNSHVAGIEEGIGLSFRQTLSEYKPRLPVLELLQLLCSPRGL
jgi:hypothetical protein